VTAEALVAVAAVADPAVLGLGITMTTCLNLAGCDNQEEQQKRQGQEEEKATRRASGERSRSRKGDRRQSYCGS
jgi:hypothetical protein